MLRAGAYTVAGSLLISGGDLAFLEGRVPQVVNREEFRIDRVALRVADTLGPFQPNPHWASPKYLGPRSPLEALQRRLYIAN
jgi:hypothetical protein